MRLDVTLVHWLGRELALDDDIRLGKSLLQVSARDLHAAGHVRGLLGLRVHALGEHVFVQERRIRRDRLHYILDLRQYVVFDPDLLQGPGRNLRCRRRDGRHRVAVVEHLVAGQDVPREVPEVRRSLAAVDHGQVG